MLTIKFIKENTELVREGLKKRNDPQKLEWLELVIEKQNEYLALLKQEEELRHRRNVLSDEVRQLKKQGKDVSEKVKEAKELPDKVKELTEKVEKLQEEIRFYLMRIPNLLHESVPVGKDGNDNVVVKTWGEIKTPDFELKSHGEIIEKLGLGDFETAAKVSGRGFYYLFGDLALMDLALQRFAIDNLTKKGYLLTEVPLMLRRQTYEGVTDLGDFETMMYKIDNEDLYLIATSEHPIGGLYQNYTFNENDLPKKHVGVSACFRKEIGSHGVDEKGLFRVHQFNKVEQFIFCKPEDSWKFHEELIQNSEELFQKLKLPYRVVSICTGDIGTVAAKKYDLEVYMPREKAYKEVVSCSNCTSYQATRLNIKYQKGAEKEHIHTLNSTAIATSRALRGILENYQQKDGTVIVPEALLPYMNGVKVLGKK
jgi:seryl-tRNA synthetase